MSGVCSCYQPQPGGCAACNPNYFRDMAERYAAPPVPVQQHGCICPPGAERTCRGPLCPRRGLTVGYSPQVVALAQAEGDLHRALEADAAQGIAVRMERDGVAGSTAGKSPVPQGCATPNLPAKSIP